MTILECATEHELRNELERRKHDAQKRSIECMCDELDRVYTEGRITRISKTRLRKNRLDDDLVVGYVIYTDIPWDKNIFQKWF